MKYFVVSDIHDHYSLMMEALQGKGFDLSNPEHNLIICGDAFYSGPQPGEMFNFLKTLHQQGRLVFIYGNHDYELLDNLRSGAFKRPGNRTCAAEIVRFTTGKTGLSDKEISEECSALGFTEFLETVPVPYFETEHYVFVHGFIPVNKKEYRPDWRNASEKDWRAAASRGDGMLLSMRYNICESDKIIVFGHYSAARCFLMQNAAEDAWNAKLYKDVSHVPKDGFKTFYGDTFIAMDQSVKKTGFVNCIVVEE